MRPMFSKAFALGFALCASVSVADAQPVFADLTPVVSTGLNDTPLGIATPGDGSNRLIVIHKGGQARVVENGALLGPAYFTLGAATQCRETTGAALANTGFSTTSEQGLLGLAFHPDFAGNGRLFVSYSGANGDSIIARYTLADPDADVLSAADLQSCVVVLRVDQDFDNHKGGNIQFGPDGYLYFGLGDGGSGGDPCNRGQTVNPANLQGGGACDADANFLAIGGNANSRALLGKMLRLDVDNATAAGANGLCASQADGSADYAIPNDNPFVAADPGCDEIYAYGLRNPWRWSFDRSSGDMLIGDVGQDRWEEVNLSSAATLGGRNFGWRTCEGRHLQGQCATLCPNASEVIIQYENSPNNGQQPCNSGTLLGCSITGGYRYRGPDARFQGMYFYGDACGSSLRYSSETAPGVWQPSSNANVVNGLAGSILSFGEDEGGALYFVAGGTLYRLGAATPAGLIFANGFEGS